jgi:hypothetical protein
VFCSLRWLLAARGHQLILTSDFSEQHRLIRSIEETDPKDTKMSLELLLETPEEVLSTRSVAANSGYGARSTMALHLRYSIAVVDVRL